MSKEHTPTPWVARDEYIYDKDRNEIATTTTSGFHYSTDEANAAHIVKCVNMHDELVEALRLLLSSSSDYQTGVAEAEETLKKAGAL